MTYYINTYSGFCRTRKGDYTIQYDGYFSTHIFNYKEGRLHFCKSKEDFTPSFFLSIGSSHLFGGTLEYFLAGTPVEKITCTGLGLRVRPLTREIVLSKPTEYEYSVPSHLTIKAV